jgi:ferredoxin--NADP+ reductase
METLREFAERALEGRPRRIVFRFLSSPAEIVGRERVEGIRIVRNRLADDGRGGVKAIATEGTEVLPVGLVFRSVGYRGVPIPGLPFDDRAGTVPNRDGRVVTSEGDVIPGAYVVGWIKRGPSGVIGTNKPDAHETVDRLFEDLRAGALPEPAEGGREALDALLRERGVHVVSFADWQKLDALEVAAGKAVGRPRLKFTRVPDMLGALRNGGGDACR